MCCTKKHNKIKTKEASDIKKRNRLFIFLTESFFGKAVFVLLSFMLMWGIPFMLFYFLFIQKKNITAYEK